MKLKRFPQQHLGATTVAALITFATAVQLGAFKLAMDEYTDRTQPRTRAVEMQGDEHRDKAQADAVAARTAGAHPREASTTPEAAVPPDVMSQGKASYEKPADAVQHGKDRSDRPVSTRSHEVADTSPVTEPVVVSEQPYEATSTHRAELGTATDLELDTQARSVSGLKVVVLPKNKARRAKAAAKPVATRPVAVAATDKPQSLPRVGPTPPAEFRPANEAWLLAQSPASFTLQLASFIEPDGIGKFVRNHHLHGQLATYETDKRNRHWYVLTKGLFADRSSALSESKTLRGKIGVKIWVRPLRDIHAEIGARSLLTAMR